MKSAFIAQSNTGIAQSNVGIAQSKLIKQDKTIDKQLPPKGDLVDAMLHYEQKPTSLRMAIKEYFRLNVNWETKTARQWMEWAVGENITPEQIERAADLWRKDKQFNWQVPSLKGIFEKWPMLAGSIGGVPQSQIRSERLERSL